MPSLWFILAPVLAAIGIIVGLGMGWRSPGARSWARDISGVFVLQLLYAALLALLAGLYFADPKSLPVPENLGGIPIAVPWFGAAGAITISMSALSEHRHDWDPEWWYWHASRPLIGAIIGTMTVLFFVAGILAVQQNPQTSGAGTATSKFLYYVIAFVIGYREASFRDLLKEVLDTIIKPGGSPATAQVTGMHPDKGHALDEVAIFGTGLSQVNYVSFDGLNATIKSADDAKLVVLVPARPAPLPATGEVPLVVLTPTATLSAKTFTYQP
jgi:hypothetical protein